MSNKLSFKEVQELIKDDLAAVDALIINRLSSDVVLINQLGKYIIGGGGKRVRPMVVLLSARACGATGSEAVTLAAIIEFIHTATLLHDDVVDTSEMRRGKETANAVFGNQAAVLTGDFLYSRAFQMMVEIQQMRVMDIMAETTNIIAEGEVLQLLNCNDPETTKERYFEVIYRKTAKLFEAGGQLGAVVAKQPKEIEQAMISYGKHLGNAFQLIDDALDYSASSEEMGKNAGDDLAEGKPTLPLIYALENGNEAAQTLIRSAIENGGSDKFDEIMEAIHATDAIQYTKNAAKDSVKFAVNAAKILPESKYREGLIALAEFTLSRSS
ncbi:MAG: octaprenyl diphosphate synthase [Thiotrichales bacterium]|jgi:octaprenyl-diphosphate synthase|nr:octaprenyl diphosphate synthase [Thiotrichales bacterium]MBT3614273.1 octaprenyl diphosphate synthase [Thiotrichales bacterium]MBT3752288.1 octaprenyl diphosphate synthase [Thiotrichales bacterium]MBT3837196.1 octaprenyl diphosphate synthase [Thiotrichales bacterium]MBT4152836.1 octaprenyl diphosphate synthase [Thiotrichales bacterium]